MNSEKYYKGHLFFIFYEKDDETIYQMFNNVYEIVKFIGKEPNRNNVIKASVKIARALKKKTHYTDILGRLCRVYTVDIYED